MRYGQGWCHAGGVLIRQHVQGGIQIRKTHGNATPAVQGSVRIHWIETADTFEREGIPCELANPFKIKAIAWASIKNDAVDERTLARLLRADLVAKCHIGSAKSRGMKQILRYHMNLA